MYRSRFKFKTDVCIESREERVFLLPFCSLLLLFLLCLNMTKKGLVHILESLEIAFVQIHGHKFIAFVH